MFEAFAKAGEAEERCPHIIKLAHLAHAEPTHEHPAVGHGFDKPRPFERTHGLADGASAHAEAGRELILVQARAGADFPTQHHAFELLRQHAGKRGGAQGCELGQKDFHRWQDAITHESVNNFEWIKPHELTISA